MKMIVLKNYVSLFCFTLLLLAASCKEKNTVGTSAMISGNENKVWKTSKETTATGEKDKLTGEEKNQTMQFFANGSFSMSSPTQNASGKWTFDAMSKNLTLQFVGSDMTENFQVVKLTDDEMTLKAADGSEMELDAE